MLICCVNSEAMSRIDEELLMLEVSNLYFEPDIGQIYLLN